MLVVLFRWWWKAAAAGASASSASRLLKKPLKPWRRWTGVSWPPSRCMWLWLRGRRSVRRTSPVSTCRGWPASEPCPTPSSTPTSQRHLQDTSWPLFHRSEDAPVIYTDDAQSSLHSLMRNALVRQLKVTHRWTKISMSSEKRFKK